MFTVRLDRLEFHAFVGVPIEERTVGHRLTVDIEMEVDGAADFTDSIEDTVDYGEVAQTAQEAIQSSGSRTLERAARLAADRVLSEYALIRSITLELSKIHPPMSAVVESSSVVIHLDR